MGRSQIVLEGGLNAIEPFPLELPKLPQMRLAGPPVAGKTTTSIAGKEGGANLPLRNLAPPPELDPPVPPSQPLPPAPMVEDPPAIGLRFAKFHPGGLNFLA